MEGSSFFILLLVLNYWKVIKIPFYWDFDRRIEDLSKCMNVNWLKTKEQEDKESVYGMVCMVYGIQIFSDLVREIETTAQFHNHLQQVRRYITLLRVNLLEGVSTISSLIVDIYSLSPVLCRKWKQLCVHNNSACRTLCLRAHYFPCYWVAGRRCYQ